MNDLALLAQQQQDRYPLAARTVTTILEEARSLLGPGIQYLTANRPDFWREAERLLGMSQALGGSPVEALIEYTMAYLKEQAAFVRSNEYSNKDFEDVRRDVYDNPDVMKRFYLEGLMLTHAFWPIHYDIHDFFINEFVARVPDAGTGTEFGFGHGLYMLEVLNARPATKMRGFDISEHARDYADRLLKHEKVEPSRYSLEFADVRQPFAARDGEFRFAMFAEIVEHIPDPHYSLRELRRSLQAGSPAFITTVVNSNAIDHIFLFKDTNEVPPLITQAGFEIVAEKILKVTDYGSSRDPSIDVAYVCIAN
jgi:hypothetical protein